MLQSFNRGNLVIDHFTGTFRVGLDQHVGKTVNVVQVVVGPTGFVGAPDQAVVDYIRATFADHPPPDLIVTIAGPAAVFARQHRQELFPQTPLLFASVDERWLRGAPLGENETAVTVVNDYPRLVDDILQVLPETRQVLMVTGSGSMGRFWRRELESEFARFQGRVEFVWSDELSLSDVLQRCASLPSHSAIVYLSFGTDVTGRGVRGRAGAGPASRHGECPLVRKRTPRCSDTESSVGRCSPSATSGAAPPPWPVES